MARLVGPVAGVGAFGALGGNARHARASGPGTNDAGLGGAVVGGDDLANDAVANDIALPEMDERDPFDLAEQLLEVEQARNGPRDVDLGHVAGHDHLCAEADPGQEHLHLFRGCVLSLVEDDEASVERAASHEGERGHFDRPPFEKPLGPFGLEHVVESVVERAQVRVDLGHQVAR